MVALTGGFYFAPGHAHKGEVRACVYWEHFHCYVEPDGLNERITLVEVSWSLHLVSEIYLSRPGCMEGYSNMDDLPGFLLSASQSGTKKGVGRSA